jgi:uncharacterized protein
MSPMGLMRGSWSEALEAEARELLARESSGHDIHHALRVRNLGMRLAELTGADRDAVEAMALLHDVGHAEGREDHAAGGARAAEEILVRIGFPAAKIPLVVRCIERHHWQPGNAGDLPDPPLEYQVFIDADRLDALGAIGIARAFAFGGAHGRPLWDPDEALQPDPSYGRSSLHHFHDKLLRLRDGMYTEPAREIAAKRTAVLEEFVTRFLDEWNQRDVKGDIPI